MSKRIRLSENRLQKLYNDVAEEVTKARIRSLRGGGNWHCGANDRDNRLYDLQLAAADAAVRSLGEPVDYRLPKDDE